MLGAEDNRYLALVLLALIAGTPVVGFFLPGAGPVTVSPRSSRARANTLTVAGTACANPYSVEAAEAGGTPRGEAGGVATAVTIAATTWVHYEAWLRVDGRHTGPRQPILTASTDATLSLFQLLADPGLDTASIEPIDPVVVDIYQRSTGPPTAPENTTRPRLVVTWDATGERKTFTVKVDWLEGTSAVLHNSIVVRPLCDS